MKQKARKSIRFFFRYMAIFMWANPKNCIALGAVYDLRACI